MFVGKYKMSIPTDALRYAGIWDVTDTYKYAMFVVSPIDNQAYVWIGDNPVTGGADPSVPNPDWVNIPPIATGDITGIIAGTGIGGGGSSGVVTVSNTGIITAKAGTGIKDVGTPQNPVFDNIGVTSLDALTGDLTTKCGGWHRNSSQTISTVGAPSFVSLAWGQSSYGDTTTISQNVAGGSTFTVNQNGIYAISIQFQYANLGSATFTDRTLRCIINCNRGGTTATILTGTYDFPDNVPTNPTQQCNGMYELKAGDQLTIQSVQYLSAGSFTLNGQSVAPADFDLNTFWNWVLLKPLP